MPIESKLQPDQLNIKDLSVEAEQRSDVGFDVKKEIKPEAWSRVKKRLRSDLEDFKEGFAYLAANAYILDSQKAAQLVSEQDKQNCTEYLVENFATPDIHGSLFFASNLRYMGVDVKKALSNTKWNLVDIEMAEALKKGNFISYMKDVMHIKSIDPARSLTYEDKIPWDAVISQINRDTEDMPRAFIGDDEAAVKIMNPARLYEVFNKKVYQNTLERFRGQVKGDADDLDQAIEIAANLRVLSAEEVKITENGLEIIDNAPALSKPNTALPEVKKF